MGAVEDQPASLSLMGEQMRPPEHRRQYNPKHLAFLVVAFLLITGIWILNILGSIPGPWSGIFGAFFTILGVLLGLIPLLASSDGRSVKKLLVEPMATHSQWNHHGLLEDVILGMNDQRGSLVVYVRPYLRGSTINLCAGFSRVDLKVDIASSVVARRINGRPFRWLGIRRIAFVAVFPSLEPGNYTVYTESREFIASVTVLAGLVTEIDWR